ncbi:MAG: nucleotide-binding universal stress UspA family protein [Natronomonas sp.]|jgi:nucleotide-binding universal stress UspA family protein|uniref:universal stress protein n=1 Tax=Natronomonas sp. TaxID=2184060 RepID=UPI00398969F1
MSILTPIDGTDRGLAALDVAAGLAERLDADLDIVNVTDERSEENWRLLDAARELLSEYDIDAEPRILIEEDAEGAGISVAVGERLVELLEANDYEFVVMGQHDEQGTVERVLVGSASGVVLDEAETPVMLV